MTRSVLLLLVSICVACTSTPNPRGDGGPASEQATQEFDGEAQGLTKILPEDFAPHVSEGPLTAHWDALRRHYLRRGVESTVREFHRTAEVTLSVIRVAGTLPPPVEPRTEVLIVVEGDVGSLSMEGKRYRLAVGSVALLPAGARGEIKAPSSKPLYAILVRRNAPSSAQGARPYLAAFERLWDENSFKQNAYANNLLARIPGEISLHAETVYEFTAPHQHAQHEELAILLQGEGTYGLGTTGNVVRAGSLLVVPPQTAHYLQNTDPRGSRLLVIHGPDLAAQ